MQIPTQKQTTLTDIFVVFVGPIRQLPGLCCKLDHDSFHLITNPMGQSVSHSAVQDVPCQGSSETSGSIEPEVSLSWSEEPCTGYPELPSTSLPSLLFTLEIVVCFCIV